MDSIEIMMVWIPALPLAAALVIAILGPRILGQQSHVPAVLGMAGSFVLKW